MIDLVNFMSSQKLTILD
jgi:hypothetical protein